jgi:hypothetical protein
MSGPSKPAIIQHLEHFPDWTWPTRYSSIIVVPMIRSMRAAISDEMRAVAKASGRSSHTSCRRKSGGDRNSSLHIVRHEMRTVCAHSVKRPDPPC